MRKMIVALLAATTLGVGAAAAADISRRAPAAPMYAPAPVFSWNGFYIGANAGWGWASGDASGSGFSGSSDMNGFVGGGQIGYNWQGASPLVLGIEADFQGTDQSASDTVGNYTLDRKLPWFGTVRGRIGYAFDRVMLYGTGGLAYSKYDFSVTHNTAPFGSISADETKTGWTLGGGVEWMFLPQWSTKLEYLYIDTGDRDVTLFGVPFTGRAKDSIVRVGVNYHF